MLQYRFLGPANGQAPEDTTRGQPWLVYSADVERPPIRWPGEARVAFWLCPCIVFYEFVPPPNPWIDAWARTPAPDVMGYSRQDYGSRVGFWRMLDTLDKHGARCTAVVNSEALVRFADVTRAITSRRWDVAGHGAANTRFVYGLSAHEELNAYLEMRHIAKAQTGVEMTGMGGAGPQAATAETPDVLAKAGFLYHTDWFCDDRPFPLRVREGRLIGMPYSVEINDTLIVGAGGEGKDFYEIVCRQFDQLYREGEHDGRVMCMSIHPNLIGQPHRIRWLDRALAYIAGFQKVWHATGEEIARHYLAHHYTADVASMGAKWEAPR